MLNNKSSKNLFKALCFGASVTQQHTDHRLNEVTGYVPRLREALANSDCIIDLNVVAAGSAHFDGAGYALLQEVINKKPDLMILDWHTTGLDKFDTLFWHSFLSSLLDEGIQVLLAIFPKRSCFNSGDYRQNYEQARMVSCKQIEILDFYCIPNFSPEKHLRDEVHTNAAGAAFYAKVLCEKICQIAKKDTSKLNKNHFQSLPFYTSASLRPNVISHQIHGDDYQEINGFSLSFNADQSSSNPKLVLDMFIGPSSPVVKLSSPETKDQLLSIWDPWCHYKRQIFRDVKLGFGCKENGHFKFEVTDELPNYSLCRNQNFDFEQFASQKKYLHLRKLFLIGADLIEVSIF